MRLTIRRYWPFTASICLLVSFLAPPPPRPPPPFPLLPPGAPSGRAPVVSGYCSTHDSEIPRRSDWCLVALKADTYDDCVYASAALNSVSDSDSATEPALVPYPFGSRSSGPEIALR